jgi:hypothetical protein
MLNIVTFSLVVLLVSRRPIFVSFYSLVVSQLAVLRRRNGRDRVGDSIHTSHVMISLLPYSLQCPTAVNQPRHHSVNLQAANY